MKLLSKIKCRAMLRKLMPLAPVIRNDIRWLSSFAMAECYCQLDLFLRSLDHDTVAKYALDSVLLVPRNNERAFALREDLVMMEGATKAQQRSASF
ncbi:hypothetical protein JG687_00007820 [Phytophthora cactorum]|uniref:Uncharacterized protein n=1 Tax=Phytophthora cactorum TaxID=29920 RepID=A0A329T1U2_9STRA|nr:hypothetical protein Pcac1_g2634 [Phytophthora cactorum]KAG2797381.1 hypothetical protein PC112_g21804 [Phytophthora cactorum]KAG2825656.1 hypothetical protein PC111_g9295 [Phytophthora cactorum]KAG2869145.1 hypothetical protein PC113_g455 [Phytophthora cactorum]KAG2876475.1 hypothetical protein PC114_g24175 [Phytophthora cactorum]